MVAKNSVFITTSLLYNIFLYIHYPLDFVLQSIFGSIIGHAFIHSVVYSDLVQLSPLWPG